MCGGGRSFFFFFFLLSPRLLGPSEPETKKFQILFLSHLRRVRLPYGADHDPVGGHVDPLGLHADAERGDGDQEGGDLHSLGLDVSSVGEGEKEKFFFFLRGERARLEVGSRFKGEKMVFLSLPPLTPSAGSG